MVIRQLLLTSYLVIACVGISIADITVPNTYPVYPDPPSQNNSSPVYNNDQDQGVNVQDEAAKKVDEAKAQAEIIKKAEDERIRQEVINFNAKKSEGLSRLKGSMGPGGPQLKGSGESAGSQLKSVDYHGGQALITAKEPMKILSGKGFDTPGDNHGTLVYPTSNLRAPNIDSKIPASMKGDPVVKQSLLWLQQLDRDDDETAKSIALVKARLKKGEDPSVLSAQLTTLENRKKQISSDKSKAEGEIAIQVVNRGLPWDEEIPSAKPLKGTVLKKRAENR